MAPRSQSAFEYLRAIETLSETEEPLNESARRTGPGGEAYDFAPTPSRGRKEKGKLVQLGERAKGLFSGLAEKIPEPDPERLQRRATVFLKHNAAFLAGIGVFAASLFAARKYWGSR